MGRVMALASLMPCDEPEASTTTSKACRAANFHPLLSFSTLIKPVFDVATTDACPEVALTLSLRWYMSARHGTGHLALMMILRLPPIYIEAKQASYSANMDLGAAQGME